MSLNASVLLVTTFSHAFLTGASSGIGHALAVALARKGTHVIVSARREPELRSLVDRIRTDGGRADYCLLDVCDTDRVQSTISEWDEKAGGLDLVIANAGVGAMKSAHKLDYKTDIEPTLRVNVLGAFATILAGMHVMLPRKHGTLVGISSLAAMRGLPRAGAYSASKAALATFLETLRLDLTRKGLTVVDVRPGFVDTPLTSSGKFPMPFLMNVEEAVAVALHGIERGDAVVTFPKRLSTFMSLSEAAPDALYRAIASRVKF